jgi:hypothetical protein
MIARHVPVTNNRDHQIRVKDDQLPGGFIEIAPGEVTQIPTPVWNRVMRTTGLIRYNGEPEELADMDIYPAQPGIEPTEVQEHEAPAVEPVKPKAKRKRRVARNKASKTAERQVI